MKITSNVCPARCGWYAIKRPTGVMLASDPPKAQMEWWCGCGFRGPAEPESDQHPDAFLLSLWNAAQREAGYGFKEPDARPWWRFW